LSTSIAKNLETLREQAPLVHNITNFVVMNNTANALLAIGASPVMAHAVEEVKAMVSIAGALVLNIGTLNKDWIASMMLAGRTARIKGIPVVLDPVGAGATPYRTRTALLLLKRVSPTIVRGNASEILALAGADGATKGVDSSKGSHEALDAARALVDKYKCVVSISGPSDLIVGPNSLTYVDNGHPMMPRVTGLGCTASAITGAFAAIEPEAEVAARQAMVVMGVAGELAAEKAVGPGSFQMHFIDALYNLTAEQLKSRLKVRRK